MESVKFVAFQMCMKSPADNSNMRTDSNQICILLISITFFYINGNLPIRRVSSKMALYKEWNEER